MNWSGKYTILFMTQAQKDAKKLGMSRLKDTAFELIDIIEDNPTNIHLTLSRGADQQKINKQYRLVYEVIKDERIIKVYRMWTHYK